MKKRLNNLWYGFLRPKLITLIIFITRGEILYISLALILATIIVFWTLRKPGDIGQVIELSTFSAVVLEGFLVAISGLLRTHLLNLSEDPTKLTTDYSGLVYNRYRSEKNLVHGIGPQHSRATVIPVVRVAWLYSCAVKINDHPDSSYELPDIIYKYYEELFSTHNTSDIHNSIMIRVDDWYMDKSGQFVMHTGRTSFYNSLVTNRAMDYRLRSGISVRELFEYGPYLHPLKLSQLSNHLGINGFVESSDGQIMLVYRKGTVSIGKRTYGDSIGASIEIEDAPDDGSKFDNQKLRNSIVRIIEGELGIVEGNLVGEKGCVQEDLRPIKIFAAYRDLLEGGKPQLLFYAETSLSKEEIQREFERKKESDKNPRASGRKSVSETDGNRLYWIKVKELCKCEVYSDKLIHKGFHLPMLPSASAGFAMLVDYLKKRDGDKTR